MAFRPGYFTRRAFRNMRHNPVLNLASVATVALSLTLLAFFAVVVLNVQQLTAGWNETLAIVAYLDQEPSAEELKGLQSRIRGFPEVSRIDYVSKAQALEQFRKRLGEDSDLLDGLGDDVLPASLEIHLQADHRNAETLIELAKKLQQDERLGDLQYGQEWLDRFKAFLMLLRICGAALGGFLIFAALVIVTNTIKLTLYARQDELEVMAMVGGTSMFIKMPYLIEGFLQGVLGGGVALLLSFLVFRVGLQESLGNLLLIIGIDSIQFLPGLWLIGLLVGGGLIGLFGSLFALRKFVRLGPS